jgi:hypothetical protein
VAETTDNDGDQSQHIDSDGPSYEVDHDHDNEGSDAGADSQPLHPLHDHNEDPEDTVASHEDKIDPQQPDDIQQKADNHDVLSPDDSQSDETASDSSMLHPLQPQDAYDPDPSADAVDESTVNTHENHDLLTTETPHTDTVFHGDDGVVYRHSQM